MATAKCLVECYNFLDGLVHRAGGARRGYANRFNGSSSAGPKLTSSDEDTPMNPTVPGCASALRRSAARPNSFVSLVTAVALLAVAVGAKQLVDIAGPLPPVSPQQRVQPLLVYVSGGLPPAESDTDILLRSLANPIDLSRFLQTHARHEICPDALTFLREYRMSLAELQGKGWRGDCNDLTNAMCEASFVNGYSLGVLSLWPREWSQWLRKPWHQVAVLCIHQHEEYIIFDNARPIYWRGSLEDYARSINKSIPPLGGKMTWRPTKQNPLARLLDHLRWNEELPENPLPSRTPQRPRMI